MESGGQSSLVSVDSWTGASKLCQLSMCAYGLEAVTKSHNTFKLMTRQLQKTQKSIPLRCCR